MIQTSQSFAFRYYPFSIVISNFQLLPFHHDDDADDADDADADSDADYDDNDDDNDDGGDADGGDHVAD